MKETVPIQDTFKALEPETETQQHGTLMSILKARDCRALAKSLGQLARKGLTAH